MASFEEQFYLENPSRSQALRRDLALLWWLAKVGLFWLTKGLMVRRAYKKAQRTGQALALEDVIDG